MNKLSIIDKKLRGIRDEIVDCRKCPLHKNRTLPVIGQGSHQAEIMLVSEAPGYWEDQKGEPFVGAAGGVLNELLDFVGIKREEVYICNILKCRPPQNRNPQKDEIAACVPYLEKQIRIIRPKLIGSLGNYATAYLLEKFGLSDKIQGISKIHGQVFEARADFGPIKIIPLYHPAVAVYNERMKETLKNDFQILNER
ncbi:MAG: uracil-DNA glycosylase [Candidatus Portnoybacteria bacterium CG03_land_8_20_14_0_80_41_10]|uniref:Type-4 uracil-DNA glycosylase n=1 Tax=Candidatus Portnoybacteria bacterium CG03_land_8_20_14_0_80_41_10 TaxID=1974808 RepID=A0A2M7BUE2_9BACT|nr:MAG: uracil-DNA glycosylase [Candidatus Portnoybacteria bacterium CG03_land_8_20_14_0_80_41_10]